VSTTSRAAGWRDCLIDPWRTGHAGPTALFALFALFYQVEIRRRQLLQ
jgi:hypothetical protein